MSDELNTNNYSDLEVTSDITQTKVDFDQENDLPILHNIIRGKYHNKVIISHLNINSIRNKIDVLANIVSASVDILLISESKIDDSFHRSQFSIPGFSTP